MSASVPLLLGIDAGGTFVEAMLARPDGTVLGTGTSGAGNPLTLDLDLVADHLAIAVGKAISGHDARQVSAAVAGAAAAEWLDGSGGSPLSEAWDRCGVTCPVRLVPDPVVAFAAGSPARSGAVLVAGTGSIAALISAGCMARRVGGHGWLLGDDGSGFWLGREAVRAVLAELDGVGEPTALRSTVISTVTGSRAIPAAAADQLGRLRKAVYERQPVALAELAPLVTRAASDGDLVARGIVEGAINLLVDAIGTLLAGRCEPARGGTAEATTALDVPATEPTGKDSASTQDSASTEDSAAQESAFDIVLAGSLLTAPGALGLQVSHLIQETHGVMPLPAGSASGGAAFLAARELGLNPGPQVHGKLTGVRPGGRPPSGESGKATCLPPGAS